MKRIFVSRPKSVLVTSRHVVHRTFDHTGHVHSFLVLDTIFLTYLTYTAQRASTLLTARPRADKDTDTKVLLL